MRTWHGLAAAVVLLSLSPHGATVKTRELEYRQGAPVLQVHGALATTAPAPPGNVKARILGLAGGADPFVPPEQVEAFKREMQTAGARFEVITYPGAKHGFTNPEAAKYGMSQLAYDGAADRESWAAMLKLFKEIWPG